MKIRTTRLLLTAALFGLSLCAGARAGVQAPASTDEIQAGAGGPGPVPAQVVVGPHSGAALPPASAEDRREPIIQGPYREIPVTGQDDGVPLPTTEIVEANDDGDRIVHAVSSSPYFLGFAGGSYHPPEGERIDPELAALVVAGFDDDRAADEVFAFVMLSRRITPARLAQLEALGVRSFGLHPHYSLKVALPTVAVDTVAHLPFVRWVGVPRGFQKVHPYLVPQLAQAAPSDSFDVWVAVVDSDLSAASSFRIGVREEHVDPTGPAALGAAPGSFEARTNGWQERALEDAGLEVIEYTDASRSFRGRLSRADLEALLARDFVQFVGPDVPATALHDESMAMVHADLGRITYDGVANEEIVVGVLDTGMTLGHQGFSPWWVTGWDFTAENWGAFNEGFGHGSHVMGSILGRKTVDPSLAGAAPGVATLSASGRLFNLKIIDSTNNTGGVNWSSVYSVMTSGVGSAPKPHILNHSWGSKGAPPAGGWFGTESQAVAFDDEAYTHKQLHVFAAGNAGPGSSTVTLQGSAKNVLTVGNVVDYDSFSVGLPGNLWSGSSRGPTGDNRWKPNVVAPGAKIRSITPNTVNQYSNRTGTSMAAPHVSGIAAQLNDHHSFLRYKPYATSSLLMATALSKDNQLLGVPSGTHFDEYGAGRVDAYRAHYSTSQHTLFFWAWPSTSGASHVEVDVPVNSGVTRITAVMTYHEAGASVGAAKALVNDWDMWIDRAPFTAGGNTGEWFAHQSSVDNNEVRMLSSPLATTHRIKLYPENVSSTCRLGLSVVVSYGDTLPDGSLTVTADDTFVQPGDFVDITASVYNPEFTASAVYVEGPNGFPPLPALHASTTTLKDGEVTDLMNNEQGGRAALLGNINHGQSRAVTWTTSWGSEGTKSWNVDAYSDNWVDKSGSVQVVVDGTEPTLVTNLKSTTHAPNVWSSDPDIAYKWTAATDNLSGVCGYGLFTSNSSTGTPAATKDVGLVTSFGETLSSSGFGYYFKMRTVDNSSNWSTNFAVVGPYLIDTVDPGAPTGLGSNTHTVNVENCSTSVSMLWTAAVDAHSGIGGYIGLWDTNPATQPGGAANVAGGAQTHTQVLSNGNSWYFHLRAVDLAGNVGPTVHAGPFVIDDSPWSTYCTAKLNSLGCLPTMSASGTPSLSASTFSVQADQLLNNKNGILFWGLAPKATPFQGGTLCVKSPVSRTPMQSTGGTLPPASDCTGTLIWDFTSAYMNSKGLDAGTELYCQVWTRDAGAPSGTNLTGGLQFTTCK